MVSLPSASESSFRAAQEYLAVHVADDGIGIVLVNSLQLRGVRPFLSDKYDLTQHPNYKYTADYDKKLTFDIEKYLSTRAKLHPKDEFFVIDAEK